MHDRAYSAPLDSQQSKCVDRAVRFLVLGFAIVALFTAAFFASLPFLLEFLLGGDGTVEFVDTSAHAAKAHLGDRWPTTVSEDDVESVSYKSISWRDTHYTWYRIKISRQAAAEWIRATHADEKQAALSHSQRARHIEGIQRTVRNPGSTRCDEDYAPDWWSPPELDYLSTERMLWYGETTSDSGVGYRLRTAYDEPAGTLWIFVLCEQRHRLWEQGAPPDATEHFGHQPNE